MSVLFACVYSLVGIIMGCWHNDACSLFFGELSGGLFSEASFFKELSSQLPGVQIPGSGALEVGKVLGWWVGSTAGRSSLCPCFQPYTSQSLSSAGGTQVQSTAA